MSSPAPSWRRWGPWAVLMAMCGVLSAGAALLWQPPRRAPIIEAGATLVVDHEALARVDLEAVHTELVPAWVVARGGVKDLHWERIRREVKPDANLTALIARMGVLIEADPVLNAKELMGLVNVWNRYLEAAEQDWRLAGEVRVGGDGGTLRLKTYKVIDRGEVTVGERAYRFQVRRRADETTQVDTWLGLMHSHEDGVVVLLDRVTQFTLDQVWPMLDPRLDGELDPLAGRFAEAIRDEVRGALDPVEYAALEATAEDRYWLNRTTEQVHFRHRCGSQFLIARVPWNGMAPRDLATLQLHAEDSADDPCPDVTEAEAVMFSTRSYHVRRTPGVREALESLVAWVAGAVVVHEARHAADDAMLDGQPIPCIGCPDTTSHVAALEGSAYLASFAQTEFAALTLYQACNLDPQLVPERAAMIRHLADQLYDGGCDATPPADLPARARALEGQVFRRSDHVQLETFPTRLPVSTEYRTP